MKENLEFNTKKILTTIEDGVGWIGINNPEKRNAVSREMWVGLAEAATSLGSREDVRVVVLYGVGGEAFASGADISEFEAHRADAIQQQEYGRVSSRGGIALSSLKKPLLAMIDGFCIGGGLGIALQADIRFASSRSKFGVPAAKLGLGYDYPGIAKLARIVGPSTTKDIFFTGRLLDAAEALQSGLINTSVAQEELLEFVTAYAKVISRNAPLTIRSAKLAVRAFERYTDELDSDEIKQSIRTCFDSQDYQEGRKAFLEKRRPVFTGR